MNLLHKAIIFQNKVETTVSYLQNENLGIFSYPSEGTPNPVNRTSSFIIKIPHYPGESTIRYVGVRSAVNNLFFHVFEVQTFLILNVSGRCYIGRCRFNNWYNSLFSAAGEIHLSMPTEALL